MPASSLRDANCSCAAPVAARQRLLQPLLLALSLLLPVAPLQAQVRPEALRAALDGVCAATVPRDAVLKALGGGIELARESLDAPEALTATRHRLLLPDGARVRLDLHRQGEQLRRVILEVSERINGQRRPRYWVVADGACRVRVARRLRYRESGIPRFVDGLEPSLVATRSSLPLDEDVPPGVPPDGVPVAMVDAGVNYTIAAISRRLARDARGQILGYDYWDLDPRPFDNHPSRSPFIPTRHGTRTAGVLLDDAPVATLVPMRYPRPVMARMAQLVADAARHGIGIVNLSLGGPHAAEWRDFERAARAHPEILFVASAGNDGRDLDSRPVYPAALRLENLITVSSSDEQGLPAKGSNWGRESVDLLVPAEGLVTTDFSGYATVVAGSSYAAARVSALAACLKSANPQWQAPELREAIFALAEKPAHASLAYVRVGVLPDPTLERRGDCAAQPAEPQRIGRMTLGEAAVYPGAQPGAQPGAHSGASSHELVPLTLVWLEAAGWSLESLPAAVARAAAILGQCGVRFGPVQVELWRLPSRMRYYHTRNALELMQRLGVASPAVWFVRDTLQQPAFDAEAIGRSNARGRPALMNTLWMTAHLEHPGVALAHELYHVLANTGTHVPERDNLMHADTSPEGVRLGDWQCDRMKEVGGAFGLVKPL